MRLFRRLLPTALLWATLLLAQGCSALSMPEAPPVSNAANPLWSDEELRQHLRFFNGSDVASRTTGAAGYAVAAAYVAARMAEFALQPVQGGEYRLIYHTPLHMVRGAALLGPGPDTLAFYPGVDFLPDGRSDSGRVQVDGVVVGAVDSAGAAGELHGQAVLLPRPRATSETLRALQDAGVRVAFAVGALSPHAENTPVEGLLVVQLAPRAAARLLQTTLSGVDALMRRSGPLRRPLPRPVWLHVETQTLPLAGAVNVLGYVPGKRPGLSSDLVIVCADLDALDAFAGGRVLDAARLGTGTAALLEVARQYAFFAQFSSVPERTLLFAVFSGALQEHAGLRAYLHYPLWPLDRTRAVIYLGLSPPDEPAVRGLLAAYGLPLYAVAPPADTSEAPPAVWLPEYRGPRPRTPSGEGDARSAASRLATLLDAAVPRARQMAEDVNALLLREAVTPWPIAPAVADTLRVPVGH